MSSPFGFSGIRILGAFLVLIALIMFVPATAHSSEEKWITSGPFRGCCTEFAYHPAVPNLVAGAGYGRVHWSSDAGIHWSAFDLDGAVNAVRIDPSNPSRIFAATRSLWISEDQGSTWRIVGQIPRCFRNDLNDLEIDPVNGRTLYAGINGGCAYKSTDGGVSWNSLAAETGGFNEIEVHPNGRILYALQKTSSGRKVIKSTNGGKTWKTQSNGLPQELAGPLALVRSKPDTLYIGGSAVTTNGGQTWSSASCGCNVLNFAVDPSDASVLYVTDAEGRLLKSLNSGRTWFAVTLPHRYGQRAGPIGVSPNHVLLMGTGYLMRSVNGGASWAFITTGPGGGSLFHVTTSQKRAGLVFVAGPSDLFRSRSRANTWQLLYRQLKYGFNAWDVEISPADPDVVAVTGSGCTSDTDCFSSLGFSTNAGDTWRFHDLTFGAYVLAMDPVSPSTLYAGAGYTVAKSTNAGNTWFFSSSSFAGNLITSLAIDPSDPSSIYAGTNADTIYHSSNAGKTYQQRGHGLPSESPNEFLIYSIQIDPVHQNTVYTATNKAVYKTTDGGLNWVEKDQGLPMDIHISCLALDPSNPHRLWAGGSQLYVSVDGGETWSEFPSEGLAGGAIDMGVSIVPPEKLFLATDDGVFTYILP